MSVIKLHTDGGARGNPGPAAIGAVVTLADGTQRTIGKYLGETTNNVAEYQGLLSGIALVAQLLSEGYQATSLLCHMDSELVVRQIQGRYRVKEVTLQKLHAEAITALQALNIPFEMVHIPRALNAQADTLVNKTLDASRSAN